MRTLTLLSLSGLLFCLPVALAQQAQGDVPPPCTQEAAKTFDFWVGDLAVKRNSDGKLMGYDTIKKSLDGCVIEQHWRQQTADVQPAGSPNFLAGRSMTVYNPRAPWPAWNQVWVDNGGSFLQLSGDFKDGRMQLASTGILRQKQRWIWEPQKDGTILNCGFFTADSGVTWTEENHAKKSNRPDRPGHFLSLGSDAG